MNAPIERHAIENPIQCDLVEDSEADQIVQPWQFGHPEPEGHLCLAQNLPPLVPTRR